MRSWPPNLFVWDFKPSQVVFFLLYVPLAASILGLYLLSRHWSWSESVTVGTLLAWGGAALCIVVSGCAAQAAVLFLGDERSKLFLVLAAFFRIVCVPIFIVLGLMLLFS